MTRTPTVAHLVMQTDGNLVAYLGSSPKWNTATHGHSSARLVVQDDGNLVVYRHLTPLWSRHDGRIGGELSSFPLGDGTSPTSYRLVRDGAPLITTPSRIWGLTGRRLPERRSTRPLRAPS